MKIIIVASRSHFNDYATFVNTLNTLGVETIVADRLKSCFLSESAPLYYVPFPKLITLIKRFDPDLVITDLPYYTPKMSKLTDRKVLYHICGDVWNELLLDQAHQRTLFARMYSHHINSVLNTNIRDIDLVLANSKWLLNIVKEKIPSCPVEVFYKGVDVNKWLPDHTAQSYLKHPAVVGIFDFHVYEKVLGLLKFTNVIRKMPDVNFYFAGNGSYFNLIKQSCPPNMFLLGTLPKPEVKKLLDDADVFVHPSGLDVLPRSVKEASLMEKPIVASNVGGIPEIVINNKTGYLCEIENVGQWVERIRFLLDNPDVAKTLGKNAQKFVMETFNWQKITEAFLENLKSLR